MAVRLKIGSYIIDAAETGSTSTTTGCLLMLPEGPALRGEIGPDSATLEFLVQVKRDTTANLKSSMDALEAQAALVNADIVLEYTSGSELASLKTSNGQWARTSCKLVKEEGALAAKVLLTFSAERLAAPNTGAGDVPGSLGPMDLEFAFDDNGVGSASMSALFKTLADAKTWVQTVRAGTGRPSFLGTHWRFRSPLYTGQRQENQPATPTAQLFSPFRATCILTALPPDLAAAVGSDVIACAYHGEFNARAPVNRRIGQAPGYNVLITGSLQVKGSHDSTFDSADSSSLAAGSWKATVRNALAGIAAHFAARVGVTIEQPDEPAWAPSGTSGEITFVIIGRAEVGEILSLVEDVKITRASRNRRLGGTAGTRVYKHRNGPMYTVSHDVTVVAKSLPSYPALPFVNSERFDEDSFTPSQPDVTVSQNGTFEYTARWSGAWTYVGPDPQADAETDFEVLAGVL